MTTTDPTTDDGPTVLTPTADLEMIGAYQGSGFRSPRYLVRRADGQIVQLSWLLYRVTGLVDGHRDLDTIAERLRAADDGDVPADDLRTLVDRWLVPAGLVAAPPRRAHTEVVRPPASTARPDHLFMLRLRTAVVPDRVAWRVAGVFAPLFRPVVVAVLLAAFVAVDVAILVDHGWAALVVGAGSLAARPELGLAVIGFLVVAGIVHEGGHVGACRYGGAVPGSMGVGMYIVWPAFYSTVTDAYRLSRAGRLRTDLGGVYLNSVVLTVAGAAYLVTGSPWLLAAVAVLHAETAWQFLPSIRLDGYYVLADLVGVPDLFSRMGPILRSLVRRGPPERKVTELKPWVRGVVTAWVVLVVPFLLFWVVLFVALAPSLAPAAWASLRELAGTVVTATAAGALLTALLAVVRIVLLVLPWASGIVLVALRLRRLARFVVRLVRRAGRAAPTMSRGARRGVSGLAVIGLVAVTAVVTVLVVRPPSTGAAPTATAGPAPRAALVPDGPPTLLGRVSAVTGVDSAVVDVAGRRVPVDVVGLAAGSTPPCALGDAVGFARQTLLGEDVTLVPDPTLPPGPPGRWRAHIVLASQLSYTDAVLSAGWAEAGSGHYAEVFRDEQRTAERDGRGMFGSPCR